LGIQGEGQIAKTWRKTIGASKFQKVLLAWLNSSSERRFKLGRIEYRDERAIYLRKRKETRKEDQVKYEDIFENWVRSSLKLQSRSTLQKKR